MSAFLGDDDQNRAVHLAFNQVSSHTTDGVRTTMRVTMTGTLKQITVRIVEKINGSLEGYDAKLREVFVVVDEFNKTKECIVTAYPSDSHRS